MALFSFIDLMLDIPKRQSSVTKEYEKYESNLLDEGEKGKKL
jgi:hypothetical protein